MAKRVDQMKRPLAVLFLDHQLERIDDLDSAAHLFTKSCHFEQ